MEIILPQPHKDWQPEEKHIWELVCYDSGVTCEIDYLRRKNIFYEEYMLYKAYEQLLPDPPEPYTIITIMIANKFYGAVIRVWFNGIMYHKSRMCYNMLEGYVNKSIKSTESCEEEIRQIDKLAHQELHTTNHMINNDDMFLREKRIYTMFYNESMEAAKRFLPNGEKFIHMVMPSVYRYLETDGNDDNAVLLNDNEEDEEDEEDEKEEDEKEVDEDEEDEEVDEVDEKEVETTNASLLQEINKKIQNIDEKINELTKLREQYMDEKQQILEQDDPEYSMDIPEVFSCDMFGFVVNASNVKVRYVGMIPMSRFTSEWAKFVSADVLLYEVKLKNGYIFYAASYDYHETWGNLIKLTKLNFAKQIKIKHIMKYPLYIEPYKEEEYQDDDINVIDTPILSITTYKEQDLPTLYYIKYKIQHIIAAANFRDAFKMLTIMSDNDESAKHLAETVISVYELPVCRYDMLNIGTSISYRFVWTGSYCCDYSDILSHFQPKEVFLKYRGIVFEYYMHRDIKSLCESLVSTKQIFNLIEDGTSYAVKYQYEINIGDAKKTIHIIHTNSSNRMYEMYKAVDLFETLQSYGITLPENDFVLLSD